MRLRSPPKPKPQKVRKLDARTNKTLNHSEKKGLVHKCEKLENGMKFYKSECDILSYKYDMVKGKLKEEKKARTAEKLASKQQIQLLTQQLQQCMYSSFATKGGVPMPMPGANPFAMFPQLSVPVPATISDTESVESIDVPARLKNANKKPENE